jgi:hypothetical protein
MPSRYPAAALLLPVVLGCSAVNEHALSRETPGSASAAPGQMDGLNFYIGNGSCRACHEELFVKWQATEHSSSYATLAAVGREEDPSCLRCHVTGYGEPHGFTDVDVTWDLANVGCEACHGPAGDHARSSFPSVVGTGNGGDCGDCEVSRICRQCHTRQQSPGFVLAVDLEKVSCSPTGDADAGSVKGD